MGLLDDLGSGPVGVDTSIFIYFIEDEPRYSPVVAPLFEAADQGGRGPLVTSSLTLMEVLVVPYRLGNTALVQRYETLLSRSRGIRLIDLTRAHLRAAARLRAATGLRTPDALQLAAALGAGCTAFVTNDRRFPPVPGLSIVQLGAYAA